jgi:hypothetical protein
MSADNKLRRLAARPIVTCGLRSHERVIAGL